MVKRSPNSCLTVLAAFAIILQMSALSVLASQVGYDEYGSAFVGRRMAPDLAESVTVLENGITQDVNVRVIIELRGDSLFLLPSNVTQLVAALAGLGAVLKRQFRTLGMIEAELPLSKVRQLSRESYVGYISPDRQTKMYGHLAQTTGAETAWGNVNGTAMANGTGVGIAILDSGIDPNHDLWYGSQGQHRVVVNRDFTGEGIMTDRFGHGSHVASMAAGNWMHGTGTYQAAAHNANLLNLRVLRSNGTGTMSNVLAAIDWAIQNKAQYNIRVLNMSLGTPPNDSYRNDPLCRASRRAVRAGILVVASAGNNGKNSEGQKLYGSINSPGIEPSVLTVGAANTFGTNDRMDDRVTSFSSRGPTRSYGVDDDGDDRKYDNLIKPEIVAPGNRLLGVRSGASMSNSASIVRRYPQLDHNPGAPNHQGVMYMSGTSMAAPVVAGAAAMIFQVRPDLSPSIVKSILMYTAQPIRGANTLEQGAGLLNIKGATEIVNLLRSDAMSLGKGASMLTGPLNNQQSSGQCSWIYYSTVCYPWGKGVITNYGFLHGDALMLYRQGMYGNDGLIVNATMMSGTSLIGNYNFLTSSVNIYQGVIQNNGKLVGDGTMFLNSAEMGNGSMRDGVVVGDGVMVSDGVVVGDGVMIGDNTAAMQ